MECKGFAGQVGSIGGSIGGSWSWAAGYMLEL
jgi:hypothetical protein